MQSIPYFPWRRATSLLAWPLLLLTVSTCGGDSKGSSGDFCEQDSDCRAGLVCLQNTCTEPGTDDCDPPCQDDEICRNGKCEPLNPPADQDGDGWNSGDDCDDLDPHTFPADEANGLPGGFEYCDGKDNDCDGQTDEDCPPCREGDTQDCGTDVGECTPGVQTCSGGVFGACSGQGPEPEKADGLDNDCDGSTDEGLPCTPGQSMACGTEEGECQPGSQACSEQGVWGECQGITPEAEKCDGRDNDCDGITDDGFMIGLDCEGAGECGSGTYECSSQSTFRCSTEPGGSQDQSRQDVCNGLDDDCDGETDEAFSVGESCLGTGLCGSGVIECLDEQTAICSSDPGGSQDQSSAELCDGFDNDCDGDTDEDFGVGQPCSGTGQCGEGLLECADQASTRCSSDPGGSQDQSSVEICDGLDNDCDGETDEGDDRDLCSPLPPHVVQATCDRQAHGCRLTDAASDCELGWWDFNGEYADGCESSDDGLGNSCATAQALDPVSDFGGGGLVTVSESLVPAGDEDWYVISGVDNLVDDEQVTGCDSYHVRITFLDQPEGIVFDVSTDSCTEIGCTGSDEFEFFTDFRDTAGIGECPCSMTNQPGLNICSAEDHTFYIRVYRVAGYPVNDTPYTIQITNGT